MPWTELDFNVIVQAMKERELKGEELVNELLCLFPYRAAEPYEMYAYLFFAGIIYWDSQKKKMTILGGEHDYNLHRTLRFFNYYFDWDLRKSYKVYKEYNTASAEFFQRLMYQNYTYCKTEYYNFLSDWAYDGPTDI